ncbi:MAG: poly-gamma-glutamate synthase PgsB [Bacteroidales bacterium]|nr:poly-gamma-glutamate synthase PgsB [Bacteroidales bacterium]HPI85938.1 poly-gamma-glutamate synthase PgsB [Bacteroidales bacterium]HPM92200.1 poly-gamma-glutamate synthase PgsB [Bacteroidales bacterium]
MHSFYILLALVLMAVIFGIIEYFLHQKRISSIPIRIHVNGTRGKSSVTRLIGAGLREGGITNITKVTGTFPRLILEDGTETYIHRKASANIIEQLSIVRFAASRKVKALVMECMALQPQYQTITEHRMIHSNVGVMTNIRMDHTDVMGHTLGEIAETLGRTIPAKEHLFTSENVIPDLLKKMADKRNTVTHFVDPEIVSHEEMQGFRYIEHRENVSLALAVCLHAGVDRNTALQGMYKAVPDAGALMVFRVEAFRKNLVFYNAFAANDPDSTFLVWRKISDETGMEGKRIVLLNTRQDRLYRAEQLAGMVAYRLEKEVDYLVLIGQSTDVVESMAIRYGIPARKVVTVGWTTSENVFDRLLALTDHTATIVAIGNMGGMGSGLVEFFEHRSI